MSRRSSNPQTPHPIWKEICPCKSSISILTLSTSCSVDFYPLTRDFNWNPELLLWRVGFVFLYNRSLPVSSFETMRMWFLQDLVLISEPLYISSSIFFWVFRNSFRFLHSACLVFSTSEPVLSGWRRRFAVNQFFVAKTVPNKVKGLTCHRDFNSTTYKVTRHMVYVSIVSYIS